MFNVHESCTPPQTIVPTFALCVVMQAIQPFVAPEIEHNSILYKCVTPYDPKAWHLTLQNTNLLDSFPNLVHDLVHGAPIGDLPPLSYTFIPDNLELADINLSASSCHLVLAVSLFFIHLSLRDTPTQWSYIIPSVGVTIKKLISTYNGLDTGETLTWLWNHIFQTQQLDYSSNIMHKEGVRTIFNS